MELGRLVELAARVRATTKKTEKVALIAAFLRETRERETALAALYLCGTLPQGRVGIGWRSVEEALAEPPAPGQPLTLAEVDRTLDEVAAAKGAGSGARRSAALRALVARAGPDERRFLAQLLLGETRQGAQEGLVLDAVARASGLPAAAVREAAMYSGDVGTVARAATEEGAAGLARFTLTLLSPIAPMLANPADDVEAALGRLGQAAFEYKVDGARIQIHKAGDEVRVFTRHLQDVTHRVPEIVEWTRALAPRELVLEGEAIAMRADGRPFPFQETMSRFGRSKDVAAARQAVPLSSFFFDLLLRSGEGSVVGLAYAERARLLAETVEPGRLLPRIVTADHGEAERFLRRSLDDGHEGLMAKSLSASYAAGQRGFSWLKLKAAHTLDLVVIAVEWGSGRREGWLSNLHLGARDPASGQFVMLGKTFKGLTDELLRWQTERLLALETGRDGHVVRVRPELVVEIAFNDVQESRHYPAGLALRFARVKRYRTDKPAAEADTIDAVRALFERQRA
ncbi:MAG: ATP-dependent DNA ligase [Vicinamibacteria bacterium]